MAPSLDVIGKSLPTWEALDKVTGGMRYVGDMVVPGVLYAKVLGSAHPHAIIKSIDVSAAKSIPEVKAVLTAQDLEERTFGSNFTREVSPIHRHARCIGDIIGVVAAETEEAAEQAIESIKVEYEVLPGVYDPVEAVSPDAPRLFAEGNYADGVGKAEGLEYGDVDSGLDAADIVIEGQFRMSRVSHAAVEPRACVAAWQGGRLEISASTQTPFYVQKYAAEYFDLPSDQVVVNVPGVGGGFGGKYQEEYIILAALLAKASDRPVKFVYTRDMENMIGRARYGAQTRIRIGAKNDGTITAQEMEQYYDIGAYGSSVGGSGGTMGAVNASIYRTANCRIRAWNVCTNTITAQKFRSVYVPTYRFAIETVMDMLEERLALQPGDLRLRQTMATGETIKPYGNVMGNHALAECLSRAREEIGFAQKWKGWGQPIEVNGSKKRGLGVGFGVGWCDWYREKHEGTLVQLNPDGRVGVETGVCEIGTGNLTAISQIVAQVLGLSSMENVTVLSPNDLHGRKTMPPWDEGTIASRTLFVGGWAAKLAAEEIRSRILSKAAARLGVSRSSLYLTDGIIGCTDDPQQQVALSDLISEPEVARGVPPQPVVKGRAKRYEVYVAPVQVHIAEVEVDTETWETCVINYVAAHDVGKMINPRIVENQLEGGIIQGISTSLYEELVFDRRSGACANPDFVDYKVATINDIPPIKLILIEDAPAEYGPFGAKGIGEHPLPAVYGAIGNAVYCAVGIRPNEVPITPERLLGWWSSKGGAA